MKPIAAMEPQRMAFLYELYKRSEGDPRRGVPYEELVEALGLGERVTKSIQCDLHHEGLIDLTTVPRITTVGRTVMDLAHRRSSRQTIGMTYLGVRLMEGVLSNLLHRQPPTESVSSAER